MIDVTKVLAWLAMLLFTAAWWVGIGVYQDLPLFGLIMAGAGATACLAGLFDYMERHPADDDCGYAETPQGREMASTGDADVDALLDDPDGYYEEHLRPWWDTEIHGAPE